MAHTYVHTYVYLCTYSESVCTYIRICVHYNYPGGYLYTLVRSIGFDSHSHDLKLGSKLHLGYVFCLLLYRIVMVALVSLVKSGW